ncbi:hypothetical protein V5799_017708 [Amblyomma americanum]|uniref:Uncharacterized protein n=1 Tax=Amblyomma americanum TaxID=6943 RepID=A0AAQ4F1Z6_AMBAM
MEMSPVEEKADKTHPVGDAREGMTDFSAEPHEHEEKGGSPGAGVQCELCLRIDMEALTHEPRTCAKLQPEVKEKKEVVSALDYGNRRPQAAQTRLSALRTEHHAKALTQSQQ